jgi:hypothetical protein
MRTTRILTAAMSGLFLLSACGSTAEKAAPTTTLSPTTTPPTTVAATTTTTAPAPTTAATTSVAPTTTTTTAVDQIAAIKQAILDYNDQRYLCLQKPTTCDPATYATGRRAESERAFVKRVAGMNLVAKRRSDDPPYFAFTSVEVGPEASTATAEACLWDTDILTTEDGAIFNEDKGTFFTTITLVLDQGLWRVEALFEHGQTIGRNECGARP